MSGMTLLETERLTLRAFTEADADDLFAMDSDPEVMRFVGPPWAPDAAGYGRQIWERLLPYYAAGGGFGYWAAVERATRGFLGWISLRPALDYRFAKEAGYRPGDYELGYRLRR